MSTDTSNVVPFKKPTLKTKRAVESNQKKIESLDNGSEKIHLPPEQRFTFHYLSSEYFALTKVFNFIKRGGIYNPEISGIISSYLLDKRTQLCHEFNALHGVCTGENFAIQPKDIDSERMNINIHSEVIKRVAEEYKLLIEKDGYQVDDSRFSKGTIQWLNLLAQYRKIKPFVHPTNNPSQIMYHAIQTMGEGLSDIVEESVNLWYSTLDVSKTPTQESAAINACLFYFNNFILSNLTEIPSSYTTEEAMVKLDSIEESGQDSTQHFEDLVFLLRMYIFQTFLAQGYIDGVVVKNLLISVLVQHLHQNINVIINGELH